MKLSKLIKEIKRVTREEDPEIAIMNESYGFKFNIKYLDKTACIVIYDEGEDEDD